MATEYLETTVVDLFDTWATRTPEATVVEYNGQTLTFAEIRNASFHVSKALLSKGVRSGDKIPILSQMSLELLPAILGVLRIGGCYVPIDIASWSKARIDATIEEISPQVAIATVQPDTHRVPVIVLFQKHWLRSPFHDMDDMRSHLDTIRRKGAALVMASSANFPEIATTCDVLILTPSMLASLDPAGPYTQVRTIWLGAEAPNFDIARQWVTSTRKVMYTYGPSEATIHISQGEVLEDTESNLGTISPGVEVFLVDENLQESDIGEILISGPCLAAGYLNNPELTAQKFIDWNGKRVYRTGDLARRNKDRLSWVGRADRMVKNRGFLVNLETEVESAMLRFSSVQAASAFMWRNKLMGFVQPATISLEKLRLFLKENVDPFVVPDEILALDQFPLTAHAKVDRAALHARLEDRMAEEDAFMDTMVCYSPYDALRWAFGKCLQVPFRNLDKSSSFVRLGGNSLAAIRLSDFLRKQGYAIRIIEILREDTIDRLEEKLTTIDVSNGSVSTEPEAVPVTDMHRLMLSQSQRKPISNSQLLRVKCTGAQNSVPTPNELHAAWMTVLSAHEIFKTRYDMQTWTLHDLGRINLAWDEVTVEAEKFDKALLSVENQVWARQKSLKSLHSSDLEVPYCRITCVYAPKRKAIGFVWHLHHVLTDIFSTITVLRDLDQALARNEVNPGPSIQDFARFMRKYKAEKLDTATAFWKRMMNPLREQSLFEFQPPQISFEGEGWRSLPFKTSESVDSIEAAVRMYNVSSATIIFAAWALTLQKYTRSNFVPFFLSRSGRMAPWPPTPSLVAAINCRVPFVAGIHAEQTLHEWLGEMHNALLGVAELENLCQSLDASICPAKYFNTAVQAFLYMPQASPSWEIHDKITGQAEPQGMVWKVQQTSEMRVEAFLEINQKVVDVEWAKEVGTTAVQMLEKLVNAQTGARLNFLTKG
ncbi:hypothetical protein N0V94_009184 [Neodidymelliopsis sp. IMI 364377]|nr:hypothetical protein N0V94_009184 [Neodidymelliopsis sp. IMI 364377]